MLLIAYGTRPEYVKLRPILDRIRADRPDAIPHRVLFTGQHALLDDEPCDVRLRIPADGHRLDAIVRTALDVDDSVFDGVRAVLVQGDTASAYGVALAAFHRGIPIAHLEAGLRTYDLANPFPEELYRQQLSRMASLHLCPTAQNRANLEAERCGGRMEVVGNTVLDHLVGMTPSFDGPVIVSLHRRENQPRAQEWWRAFDALAVADPDREFLFLRHPSVAMEGLRAAMPNVRVTEPLAYDALLPQLASCRLVITDSGGFQEEGSFLRKRIIVCRRTTERPEALISHAVLCAEPSMLGPLYAAAAVAPEVKAPCPFGDGHAAARVVPLLAEFMGI